MIPVLKGRIGFAGFGISNNRLLQTLLKKPFGSDFFVSEKHSIDDDAKLFLREKGIEFEENGHTSRLMECDSFVVSPGISPFFGIGKEIVDSGKPFTTELEVSLDILNMKPHGTVIGITGTNGKSTTVTMLSHILSRRNKRVFQGGNLGEPLSVSLEDSYDFYVLEVSSFQLKWFSEDTRRFHLSAIINLGEDHLDYHKTFEDYCGSKLRLIGMTEGFSVVPSSLSESCSTHLSRPDNVVTFSMFEDGKFSFKDGLFRIGTKQLSNLILPYEGLHNYEDTLVVATISYLMGIPPEVVFEDLKSYSFLSHRLQLVREIGGVKYYDDSKATNAHAVSSALKSFVPEKTVLILGGKEKDESYRELIEQLKRLKLVVVLGSSMKTLMSMLVASGIKFSKASSMEEAVRICADFACGGDSVLLSPAGSSFDLYKNYAERGKHFRGIVDSLESITL